MKAYHDWILEHGDDVEKKKIVEQKVQLPNSSLEHRLFCGIFKDNEDKGPY